MLGRPDVPRQHAFLMQAYFGTDGFISRAYRDMNRTLHGLSKLGNAKELVETAKGALRTSLSELQGENAPTKPDELAAEYDRWHEGSCDRLIACFQPFHLHHGQAQKWLNMTIKYHWFFRVGGELDAWYPAAHVPVDEFILHAAAEAGIERPCEKWSRWDDRARYEVFQKAIRAHAAKLSTSPLALEHDWWMREAARR